jgi:hypothetical protein
LEAVNLQKDTSDGKEVIVVKKVDSSSLFSKQEIREFVREFVASWIRGDIVIRFPTATDLAKKTPFSVAFPVDPSVSAELKIKEHYIDLLSVCAGTKQASAEEREKAVTEVFRMLLMFRSANRIEGKIISSDWEKRLSDVEKTLNATGKLVEQITGFLFTKKKKAAAVKKREG